jgi:TRAP-type C4-dicarboxylate transport system substrate-binding protein
MKRVVVVLMAVLLSTAWLVCSPVEAQEKVVSLKFANFFPPDNKISIAFDQWCKEVEKRTNGAVKITLFSGGTLTPPAQTYISVTRGVADIGYSFFLIYYGTLSPNEVLDLPLGYKQAM